MKNTFLKTICTTMAFLMLTVFAQISVFAQDDDTRTKVDEQSHEDLGLGRNGLVGVWNLQVTRVNCSTGVVIATFPAMHVYREGGTMDDFGTQNSPTLRSPAYGVWNYESGRRYSLAYQFFRFNPDGTLAGTHVARQQNRLGFDGNSLTQTSIVQIIDLNGTVLSTNCATAIGTRFE